MVKHGNENVVEIVNYCYCKHLKISKMKLILVASNSCNSSMIKLIKFMDNVYDFGIGFTKVPPTNKKLP
jgi:hypothetical protein